MSPQIIFGDVRRLDPNGLRIALRQAGISRLDTAALYGNGESEKKIGQAKLFTDFTIDTKVFWELPGLGSNSPEAVEKSLFNSLRNLNVESVDTFYCHGPDYATPIVEQARAFDIQYRKKRFVHLGVSNLMPDTLAQWLQIADREGYIKPSVFQGQFNLLCRGYEESLFPVLKEHGLAFRAYSPLAGGFLLGNFTAEGVRGGSRFASANLYTRWYNTPAMHDAVRKLQQISQSSALGMDELSLRWLVYHSALGANDGIILGASKLPHIGANASQIGKGPLPESVVSLLNELWEDVREDGLKIIDTSPRAWQT